MLERGFEAARKLRKNRTPVRRFAMGEAEKLLKDAGVVDHPLPAIEVKTDIAELGEILTIQEAMKMHNISRGGVRHLMWKNPQRATRVDGKWLIDKSLVENWKPVPHKRISKVISTKDAASILGIDT